MTLEMKLKEQYNAGIKQGRVQGREEGKTEAIMDLIQQKLANGKSVSQIANECERSVETIQDLIAEMELNELQEEIYLPC